jgi:hypothetical protein
MIDRKKVGSALITLLSYLTPQKCMGRKFICKLLFFFPIHYYIIIKRHNLRLSSQYETLKEDCLMRPLELYKNCGPSFSLGHLSTEQSFKEHPAYPQLRTGHFFNTKTLSSFRSILLDFSKLCRN